MSIENTSKQKQLQKAQLKIAREIKRICEKNNINYFLDGGSMLGAIRHKGFIPWDDDMDIGMLDEDYNKFLEVAPKELGKEFFLDNYETNKEYGLVFSKVKLRNTIYREKLGPVLAEHQEIFVDVFPYFYRPENDKDRKKQSNKLRILSQILMAQSGFKVWKGNRGISKLKFVPIILLAKILNKEKVYNKQKTIYNECKNISIVGVHDSVLYIYWYFKKSYLEKFIDAEFENEKFKIPANYHEILTTGYGDYMILPPVEERRTHDILELELGNINDL